MNTPQFASQPSESTVLSPGKTMQERLAFIEAADAVFETGMRQFLNEVELLALQDVQRMTLVASSGADDDSERPSLLGMGLTLGSVFAAWMWAMRVPMEFLAAIQDPTQQVAYWNRLQREFEESLIPRQAHDVAKQTVSVERERGGTFARIKKSLSKALAFGSGQVTYATATTVDDPLEGAGMTWEKSSQSLSRTESADAYNRAALGRIRGMGEGVTHKRWVSHHDDRTRETHRRADGQTVPIDSPFHVGRDLLDYPGDSSGSNAETRNCRCGVVAVPSTGDGKVPEPPTDSGVYGGLFGGYA